MWLWRSRKNEEMYPQGYETVCTATAGIGLSSPFPHPFQRPPPTLESRRPDLRRRRPLPAAAIRGRLANRTSNYPNQHSCSGERSHFCPFLIPPTLDLILLTGRTRCRSTIRTGVTSVRRNRYSEVLLVGLIIGLVFAIYYPVIAIGMISDDFSLVRKIAAWNDIWRMQGGWSFRYVGNAIFWADGVIWRGSFAGRHFGSLLIQAANVIAAFLVSRHLFRRNSSALLCTAIYAMHFANVGSTAWPSDKWTLSAALFILTGFYASLRYFAHPSAWNLIAAVVVLALGLLTKEIVVMLIPAVALYQWTRGVRLDTVRRDRHLHIFYGFTGTVLAAYVFLRFGFAEQAGRNEPTVGGAYAISLGRMMMGLPFYVTYAILPFDFFEVLSLSPEVIRHAAKTHLDGPLPYALLAGFGVTVTAMARALRIGNERMALFGISWLVAFVVPFVFWFDVRWLNPATFGVAIILTALAERWTPLPALGILSSPRRLSARDRLRLLAISMVLVSLACSSRRKVGRWVEAGALVERILVQTSALNEKLPQHSLIVFLNLPEMIGQAQVFRNGIEEALRVRYGDRSLSVYHNSEIIDGPIPPSAFCTYASRYRLLADRAKLGGGTVRVLQYDSAKGRVSVVLCAISDPS